MTLLNSEALIASPANSGARSAEGRMELLEGYPDMLTVQHLREITGQSEQTLRALIKAEEIPGCRIGRRLYVSKPQLIEYIMKGGGLND